MPRPRKTETAEAAPAPEAVRLLHPYAYFTEHNVLRAWDADHVETDADEIANLIARGAPIVEHEV